MKNSSFKIDDTEDIRKILEVLENNRFNNYIITGGGYTGIETASNLWLYLRKRRLSGRIIIVERASSILGTLPEWIKEHIGGNLKRCGVEVKTKTEIKEMQGSKMILSSGEKLGNSMLLWTVGVQTPGFVRDLPAEKSSQGRLKVDPFLRIRETVFAAGDSAFFETGKGPLRMAVQFAITEGKTAADNIIRSIRGKKLLPYKPLDPGYIIPMADNDSCGIVLGMKAKGRMATMLHYFMCLYRSCSCKNRIGIIKDLFKS